MKTSTLVLVGLIGMCLGLDETSARDEVASQSTSCKVPIYTSWDDRVRGGTPKALWSPMCQQSLTADFPMRNALNITTQPDFCWKSSSWGPQPRSYPSAIVPVYCNKARWERLRVRAVMQMLIGMNISYCHYHTPFFIPPVGDNVSRRDGKCSPNALGKWQGVDCSSYTSFVYNYGLGGKMSSSIAKQACGPEAPGVALPFTVFTITANATPLLAGDTLYIAGSFYKNGARNITHTVLWTGFQANLTGGLTASSSNPLHISNLFKNLAAWEKKLAINGINEAISNKSPIWVISDAHNTSVDYRPFVGWYQFNFSHARRMIAPPSVSVDTGLTFSQGECFGRPAEKWWNGK